MKLPYDAYVEEDSMEAADIETRLVLDLLTLLAQLLPEEPEK